MKWIANDHPPATQGQIKFFWSSLHQAVNAVQHAVGLWSPLIQTGHPTRILYSFQFMHPHFFCSVKSKVQVGKEDLRSDAQPDFAPRCSLEAHLSLAAQLRSQFPQSGWCPSAIFRVAHQPTQQPSSCLGWFEEASDSLCALPEASLLLLVIVKWKFRLFPASDISISITALIM